jgi:hypothetical protein
VGRSNWNCLVGTVSRPEPRQYRSKLWNCQLHSYTTERCYALYYPKPAATWQYQYRSELRKPNQTSCDLAVPVPNGTAKAKPNQLRFGSTSTVRNCLSQIKYRCALALAVPCDAVADSYRYEAFLCLN